MKGIRNLGPVRMPPCRLLLRLGLVLLVALGSLLAAVPARADMLVGDRFGIAAFPGDDTRPKVAFNPLQGLYLVTWESGGWITYRMVSESGTPLNTALLYTGNCSNPDVAYSSAADQFLVVWSFEDSTTHAYDIVGARLSGDGTNILGTFIISAGRTDDELAPSVAYNSFRDEYLVAWVDGAWLLSWPWSHWDIYAARVAGAFGGANLIGSPFLVATTGFNGEPAVAYHPVRDEYLVVWTRDPLGSGGPTDVYARRVPGAGLPSAPEAAIDASSSSQYSPAVACYPGSAATPYLVVYRDDWTDWQGQSGVRSFMLNADGQPVSLRDVAVSTSGQEGQPAIAASAGLGGYTVVWAQNRPTVDADWNVWGRHVIAGVAQPAFNVSAPPIAILGDNEQAPALASGSHAAEVVWQGNSTVTSTGWDIAGRLVAQAVIFMGNVYRGSPGDTSVGTCQRE